MTAFIMTCCTALLFGCASNGPAHDTDSLISGLDIPGSFIKSGYSSEADLNFLATFPPESGRTPGLVVFLHSMEERGNSLHRVYDNPAGEGPGLAKIALEDQDFPFITLSPLCPRGTYWTFLHRRLGTLIREFIEEESIDGDRVYLTGVSMGGMGTWSMAMAQPDLFAGIVPISAAVYSPPIRPRYRRIAEIPALVVHDLKDPSIPYDKARKTVQRFQKAGGTAEFVRYDSGEHYIHTNVYRSDMFIAWLMGVGTE
ncbi:prolyl oligopeptidase family serine peptidase [Salinispira pacifica]|uniref:carboxylesterase family protein n=1 Tax=Salinispira pacifica TaxID=1307761 RepID=UPI00146FB21F|nr:prolyl oligopeptidase family serine peptidase [Salinispira pacifica]